MLRRLSSSPALLASKRTTSSPQLCSSPTRRMMSDSLERPPNAVDAATRFMCDTTEGTYNSMLLSNTTGAANGAKVAGSEVASKRAARANGSIFGDSPAAVGTSLIGCLCFGATYGYYIGGAVMQAANDKRE